MISENKFKVLIIDDDPLNIEVLSSILTPEYTVLSAKDGMSGIEAAQNDCPDIILLDVIMPNMSGFETLTILKNFDLTCVIPVIFITGRDSVEDEAKGLMLGAVDYIKKPFHPSIIDARVRAHLQTVQQIRAIERLCRVDALTNIPNRRSFDEQVTVEWERAMRDARPLSLLMIDLDNFKIYNDAHGHPQGDVMLKTVAAIFKKSLKRPADSVFRWGGEEFAVILPGSDLESALEIAEQIRSAIEYEPVPTRGGRVTRITVSIGVNSEFPGPGNSIYDFIANADRALYAAKKAGKNIVCQARGFHPKTNS